jgi:amino acid transporter
MTAGNINRRAENFVESEGKDYVAVTDLEPGTVGLIGAIMQNVTHIAPAIAAFFFTQTLVTNAGGQAPLAYLIGLLIAIPLGVCLMELAQKFPTAGGYFTYVSRTLGPSLAVLGQILQDELSQNYGVTWFHWWYAVVIGIPLVTWAAYSGVSISIRWIVAVGAAEFLIVLALALTGLANPGPGGFSFAPFTTSFNPGGITTTAGFFIAVVLTVQGLTGWEAAVPLAEETENPRPNVPRSIMASILIIGVMLVIAQWGQLIGWGTEKLPDLIKTEEVPALVIAHRVWGPLWWLTLLAMITSVLGASLACQNVATRMWYSMGRAGVLPASFGLVHPVRKTPTMAITAQLVLSLILGFVGPGLMGPWPFFIFLIAYVLVLGIIFVYNGEYWSCRVLLESGAGRVQLDPPLYLPGGDEPGPALFDLHRVRSPARRAEQLDAGGGGRVAGAGGDHSGRNEGDRPSGLAHEGGGDRGGARGAARRNASFALIGRKTGRGGAIG